MQPAIRRRPHVARNVTCYQSALRYAHRHNLTVDLTEGLVHSGQLDITSHCRRARLGGLSLRLRVAKLDMCNVYPWKKPSQSIYMLIYIDHYGRPLLIKHGYLSQDREFLIGT